MKVKNVLKYRIFSKNINHKKIFIISFLMVIAGAFIYFVLQPQITKFFVKYLCTLTPGRYLRKRHEMKQQFSYKLFLWNVTNPDEITNGTAKPKLDQIGPYVFTQFKQKTASSDNETEDSFSFDSWNVYFFDRESSAPLTGDEMLTLLNPVLVGGVVKVKLERPSFINVAIESMDLIFKNPSSMFITMSGTDFIDNGFQIDCNQTLYPAKAACAEMRRNKILKIMNADKTLLRFRWFDRINDTSQVRYTVKRGSGSIKDIGVVIAVNSEAMLKIFKEDTRCNVFNGTDKTIFPPFQKKHEIVWAYSSDACRSFPLRFKYMTTVRNANTAYKSAYFTDPLANPACNCNKYSGCAYDGTVDLHPCTSLFLSGSPPHFYSAAPYLQESLEGMYPDERLHQSGTYFDLLSGAPIYALERGQLNVLVKRIPEYHIFSSIADDIWLPFLWYEEEFSIAKVDLTVIKTMKAFYKLGFVTSYTLSGVGIFGCLVAGSFLIHQRISIRSVMPAEATKNLDVPALFEQ